MAIETFTDRDGSRTIEGFVVTTHEGDFLFSLLPRRIDRDNKRAYFNKSRVYGATDVLAPAVLAQQPRYVPFTNADSSERDVADERAWLSWRRRALRAVTKSLNSILPTLAPVLGEVGRAKFSYNAGCSSCPCSPGYVLDRTVWIDGSPVDFDVLSLDDLRQVA